MQTPCFNRRFAHLRIAFSSTPVYFNPWNVDTPLSCKADKSSRMKLNNSVVHCNNSITEPLIRTIPVIWLLVLPQSSTALALASDVTSVGHLVISSTAISRHSATHSLRSNCWWCVFLLKVKGLSCLPLFTAISMASTWPRCTSDTSCFGLCYIVLTDCHNMERISGSLRKKMQRGSLEDFWKPQQLVGSVLLLQCWTLERLIARIQEKLQQLNYWHWS